MNIDDIKDWQFNAWYRGSKVITIEKVTQINNVTKIFVSNQDRIILSDENDKYIIQVNKELIYNRNIEPTEEQLKSMYINILKRKGYKFL